MTSSLHIHILYKNGTVYEVGFKLVKRSDTAFFREIVCLYLVRIYFFLCYWVECISHLYNMYDTYCTLLVVAKTALHMLNRTSTEFKLLFVLLCNLPFLDLPFTVSEQINSIGFRNVKNIAVSI